MSSSLRVRPGTDLKTKVQAGRFDHNEAGRLSSNRVRNLLGEKCTLDNTQLEQLTDGLFALADFTSTAFVEQRKQRNTAVSEQPVLMPESTMPVVVAVAKLRL